MTDLTPIECEARLVGLSKQRRKDGDWIEVKFHIHPDDHPAALFILPLGTDCNLSIKGTGEGAETPADEQTAPEPTPEPQEPERPKGGARAKRAGILCSTGEFRHWMFRRNWRMKGPMPSQSITDSPEDIAAKWLRHICHVESRAELDHNEEAGRIFDGIVDDYYASQRGETPEALAEQARMR